MQIVSCQNLFSGKNKKNILKWPEVFTQSANV